jgi:hypothetical protein
MGAYVTSSEIVERLGDDVALQLTTDTGSVVNTSLIDDYIAEVEGDIDQFVRKRTSETITQADYPKTFAMLRGKAVTMTIHRLHLRRDPGSESWKGANEKAVADLERLAKGENAFPDRPLNEPRFISGSEGQNASAAGNRGL